MPKASNDRFNRQSEPTNSPSTGGLTGNGLEEGDRDATTAVELADPGSGSGNGADESRGTGEGTGTEEETGTEESDHSAQNSRSRKIVYSGCDFDYPESTNGAEGTAQVIVEANGQGR